MSNVTQISKIDAVSENVTRTVTTASKNKFGWRFLNLRSCNISLSISYSNSDQGLGDSICDDNLGDRLILHDLKVTAATDLRKPYPSWQSLEDDFTSYCRASRHSGQTSQTRCSQEKAIFTRRWCTTGRRWIVFSMRDTSSRGKGVRTITRTMRTDYVPYTLHLESFPATGRGSGVGANDVEVTFTLRKCVFQIYGIRRTMFELLGDIEHSGFRVVCKWSINVGDDKHSGCDRVTVNSPFIWLFWGVAAGTHK